MIYFTSDPHLGHANILKYASRPFPNVEVMNNTILTNWNNVVTPKDEVYLVGDVSFLQASQTRTLLNRLNGKIYLVRGNHDKIHRLPTERFEWIKDMFTVKVQELDYGQKPFKQEIVLCHYAMRVWDKSHFGAWHLYGHSHGTLPDDPHSLSFDIGVDSHNFTPLSYFDVKKI